LFECVTLSHCLPEERAHRLRQATDIFFETAATRSFGSTLERDAFFIRWFGHYAGTEPEAFLFALTPKGDVSGYVAGCIDSFSEGSRAIIDDIPYFTPAFRTALAAYPSHFHINVKPGLQGKGIGRLLTGRFVQICAETGSPGIHIVTGASSPAVKFYEACNFTRLSPCPYISAGQAILARAIGAPSKEQMHT
jgi:ribosomal protein S18 acetylase RimI-like enzyme